eukprot:TRINITY_DN41270_c0_g1_i1.p1 TRINITY_DN41270_c0_g1~~TRINITY_DN41270_c0_g1_i1.p1  ORF type:complete len:300 (-),score=40.56 TRINITY_DN41270_c0_g1_i1:50-949(-)
MAYFLTRDEPDRPKVGKRCLGGRGGRTALPGTEDAPHSPLGRLVADGYVGKSSAGRPPRPFAGESTQTGCNVPQSLASEGYIGMPTGGVPPRRPSEGAFGAGVAEHWNSNIQHNLPAHQQQDDPNFVQQKPKTHGFKVSQSAGGNSSISLAWGDAPSAEPVRRGRGAGMEQPAAHPVAASSLGQRAPSPAARGSAGSRASSRESAGVFGSLGGASYGDAAYARQPKHELAAAAVPPLPPSGVGGRHVEATSLAFGNRADSASSNAYANGSNQNVGNGITDRRTTRVLQPPGGGSQFSFA